MAPLLPTVSPSPAPLSRRQRLRARLGRARRQAAVVTSVGLLAAGAGVVATPTTTLALDAPAATVAAAPIERATPPPVPLLPPTVSVSNVAGSPLEGGMASYYGAELAGNATASGERFDPSELTAAHRTLPFGTRVRVTNAATGQSVVVRINDRGPFHDDRVIDVSTAAAQEIGLKRAGTAEVELERLPTAARG